MLIKMGPRGGEKLLRLEYGNEGALFYFPRLVSIRSYIMHVSRTL